MRFTIFVLSAFAAALMSNSASAISVEIAKDDHDMSDSHHDYVDPPAPGPPPGPSSDDDDEPSPLRRATPVTKDVLKKPSTETLTPFKPSVKINRAAHLAKKKLPSPGPPPGLPPPPPRG